ncbi:MAG TPA: hypothetical protein VII24_04795 [Pseudolabrys sp.]
MPRRAATVTQADVSRTIRAVLAAHLTIIRVVTRPDGVSIETTETQVLPEVPPVAPNPIVL